MDKAPHFNPTLKGAGILLSIFTLSALSSCGSVKSTRTSSATALSAGTLIVSPTGLYPTPTATPSPSSSPTASPTPSPSVHPGTGLPPLTLDVRGTGYVSVSYKVRARSVLKVRFTPGTQDANVAGTGFSPQYSGLGVYIEVGSSTQMTPLLYNGLYGGQAQSSTFDFSSALTTACAASDTACRDEVTITVSHPNYDYWCINYGTGCSWAHVHDTHPWHGTMLVQTDDVGAL